MRWTRRKSNEQDLQWRAVRCVWRRQSSSHHQGHSLLFSCPVIKEPVSLTTDWTSLTSEQHKSYMGIDHTQSITCHATIHALHTVSMCSVSMYLYAMSKMSSPCKYHSLGVLKLFVCVLLHYSSEEIAIYPVPIQPCSSCLDLCH